MVSARIAERFGKPKSTIQAIVKKWREQHTVERLRGTGLKKISTNEEDENLVQFLRDNPFETAVSAARVTQFPGYNRTAQLRVVQCSNLRNRSAASKPFLQNIHKEQRMGFALQYLPVGLNFWTRNVIFSDEKCFNPPIMGGFVSIDHPVAVTMKITLKKGTTVAVFLLTFGLG